MAEKLTLSPGLQQSVKQVDRRTVLKWLGLTGAAAVLPLGLESCAPPDIDQFVLDQLMTPVDIDVVALPESFRDEYSRFWGMKFVDPPQDPGEQKPIEFVIAVTAIAKTSTYATFREVGVSLSPLLTKDKSEAQAKEGVYVRSIEPFRLPDFDTAQLSSGPLYGPSGTNIIGGQIEIHRQWMQHPARLTDLKNFHLMAGICHEDEHIRDFQRILRLAVSRGYSRLQVFTAMNDKYQYLLEARGHFISSTLAVRATDLDPAFKPTREEGLRPGYSDLYDGAERLLKLNKDWRDESWIGLIQSLLKQGYISACACIEDESGHKKTIGDSPRRLS